VGEKEIEPLQFTFNGFLKVAFQGSPVTSDAGLILVRELDERLGLEAIIAEHLRDSRQGLNPQFRLPDLLRQSIDSRLAGYEDLNDAARLSTDPTFRLIGSSKRWDRSAALTSTLHWFETEWLTRAENLVGLMAVNRDVIGQAEAIDRSDRTVLDMDSSESPVHGQQEGSASNGHFETVITRCFCSAITATAWPRSCDRGTSPARTTRRNGSCPRSTASRPRDRVSRSAPTRPLRGRRSTRRWRHAASSTRFGSRPTRIWSWQSKTSCFGRRVGPAGSR
jgi:hypothetical protein